MSARAPSALGQRTAVAVRERPSAAASGAAPEAAPVAGEGTVSVVVPVVRDPAGLDHLHRAYRAALEPHAPALEFVYVLGRAATRALAALERLKAAGEPLRLVVLSRWDGEAAALRAGLHHTSGAIVLTLPSHLQVEPADLPAVLEAAGEAEMAVGRRGDLPRNLEARVFHGLIRALFGHVFADLVCRVRAYRRPVLEELAGYSLEPHFLPLLASDRGFRIREVEVREGPEPGRRFRPLRRLRLTLDILTFYVVLKFVRKPLRFFGSIGLPVLAAGVLLTAWLGIARLFFGVGLADRPALILSVLLVVLGIQIIALGLIGEIIVFAAGKRIKDYTVEKVL